MRVFMQTQQQDIPVEVPQYRPFVTEGDTTYLLEKGRDVVRMLTTFGLIFLFIVTVLVAFYSVIWHDSQWKDTKDLIEIMLPAETALIVSVVGFYFATKTITPDKS